MSKSSPTKIEKRTLNVLESIIDKHDTIDYMFNYADKEMSWDGFIWLPENEKESINKANFGGRIPVQIKGHEDYSCEYINKKAITYTVDLADLRAYSTEKGVLYFQIFINDKNGEVFYSSLFPSKIADILERAEQKGNKETKRIPFVKMSKDPSRMASIVIQFNEEAKKQGTVFTPLVVDRIRTDEFEMIKELKFTVFGVHNTIDALMRISSGDICFYGKLEGDKYLRPLETLESPVVTVKENVFDNITIEGEVFYDRFQRIYDSKEGVMIILSPNLKINLSQRKISLSLISSVEELYRDVRFILLLKGKSGFQGKDTTDNYVDPKESEELDIIMNYIINLYETMKMVDLDVTTPFLSYTEKQRSQLTYLVNLRNGAYNQNITENFMKYLWKFENKYVPLLIIKTNDKIELCNAIYTKHYAIFLPNEMDNSMIGDRMPLFAYQQEEILSNLYYYDFDVFREQINQCDINNHSSGALLQVALKMINVFDICNDMRFLELAEYIFDLIEKYIEADILMINRLQIKNSIIGLDSYDEEILENISNSEARIQFGKNVLLKNKELATKYFNNLSATEKNEYLEYPIFTLYQQL